MILTWIYNLLNDHGIFTIDELNELFPVVKPYFSALHWNIRSLNQHFADLCNLLDATPFTFDFIGCSETWLSPKSYLDCFSIPGYVFINDNRNDLPLSIRNKSGKIIENPVQKGT